VSRNSDFHAFLKTIISTAVSVPADTGASNVPSDVAVDGFLTTKIPGQTDTVNDAVINAIATIRENIVLRRMTRYQCDAGVTLGSYVHGKLCDDISVGGGTLQVGTQAAIVQMMAGSGADAEACCRKLAMHIVAANPSFIRSEDAPADLVEREKAIFR
jgi:elongation factor Ts